MEPIAWLAIIFEGGLLLLAFILGWWNDSPLLEQIHLNGRALIWGILATIPLLLILAYLQRSHWGPFRRLCLEVENEVIPLFAGCSTLQLGIISVLAGAGEEALFRGVIQTGLSEIIHPWLALTAASLLFGLGHWITPTYAIVAGIVGGYLGLTAMASNNLLVPMLAHALYDFLALSALLHQYRNQVTD
ncbi:MAG: CPBP family intramembrane glutamic endopeptidase [Acidobacteriota bacterium]